MRSQQVTYRVWVDDKGRKLTDAQRNMLLILAAEERMTVRELGEVMGYRSTCSTHRHLVRLRELGLVERAGAESNHNAGYRLAADVVVGTRGYVGRWLGVVV